MEPESDDALAARLATEVGELLQAVREDASRRGLASRALGDEADRQAHALILRRLREARPGDAVLSEEGDHDPRARQGPRVWIVDPLDGTREYTEPGRVDWAVHIALTVDGELTAGAVALPAKQEVYSSKEVSRAYRPLQQPWRVVVSRSRPPRELAQMQQVLRLHLVEMGSAGAKAMAVVRGDADAYVHSGGQYEWDSAAPVVVARAAGLHTSRLDGTVLHYNRADPALPDLLICRKELAEPLLSAAKQQR